MSNPLLSSQSTGYVRSIRALSPIGSEVLTIGGSLISFANVLASASVVYVCLVHPRTDRISHLCTAIAELLLGVLTIASLVYSMMYDVLMPQTPCAAFGFLVHFTVSIDIVAAICLAIVTWLKVNHSYRSKTGVYDWKLWAMVVSLLKMLFPNFFFSFCHLRAQLEIKKAGKKIALYNDAVMKMNLTCCQLIL